jgi:hypothetical protein
MSQKQIAAAIKAALPQLQELATALATEAAAVKAAKTARKAVFDKLVPTIAAAFEAAGVTRAEADAPVEALVRAAYGLAKSIALTGAARQAKRRLLDALFGAVVQEWELEQGWMKVGRALAVELFGHEADGKACHSQLWAAVGSSLFAELQAAADAAPKKSSK